MKYFALAGLLLAVFLLSGCVEETPVTFSVFQDRLDNPKETITLEDVGIPLDRKEVCTVAKESCGSTGCLDVKRTIEIPGDIVEAFRPSVGSFDWAVELEPVCGPTTAFINEREKTVVCFCAYE